MKTSISYSMCSREEAGVTPLYVVKLYCPALPCKSYFYCYNNTELCCMMLALIAQNGGRRMFGFFCLHFRTKHYIINLFIILAKFLIHKCKFTNRKPLFKVDEMQKYIQTNQHSLNLIALKTLEIYIYIYIQYRYIFVSCMPALLN